MAFDENGDYGFGGAGLRLINNGSSDANNLYSGRAAGASSGGPGMGGIRSVAPQGARAPEIAPANGAQPDNPLLKLLTPAVAFGTAAGNPAGGALAAGGAALLFKYIDHKYGNRLRNWMDPMVPAAGEPDHQLPGSPGLTVPGQMQHINANPNGSADPIGMQLPQIPTSGGTYLDPVTGRVEPLPSTPNPDTSAPQSIYVSPFQDANIPGMTLPSAPEYNPKMVRSSLRGYMQGQN